MFNDSLGEFFKERQEEAVAAECKRCAAVARSLISTDTDWDVSYWNQACERIALKIETN